LLDFILLGSHFTESEIPPSNLPYILAAFAVSWVVLFGYLFYVNRRQHEVKKEIAKLQNQLDQTSENEE